MGELYTQVYAAVYAAKTIKGHAFRAFKILRKPALISLWFIIFFTCLSVVNAATISGSVYDLALQKETDTIIEINTLPKQLVVSKDGDYTFNVKPGNYTLLAYSSTSRAVEPISVMDEGNYTLDIILEETMAEFPDEFDSNNSFGSFDDFADVSLIDISESSTKTKNLALIFGLILLIFLVIVLLFMFIYAKKIKSLRQETRDAKTDSAHEASSKTVKSVDEYEHKVLQIVKREKRTTQKDLRKEIPLSEAKISLIVSDLESKGKIRKVKKGRGNILIFVKD